MSPHQDPRNPFAILLISNDQLWSTCLLQALEPLGNVQAVNNEEDGLTEVRNRLKTGQGYGILVIDIGTTGRRFPSIVNRIRAEQEEARVVVAAVVPTWRQAKMAFQAGAVDYIRKSLDAEELLRDFRAILKKRIPPWQPNDHMPAGHRKKQ